MVSDMSKVLMGMNTLNNLLKIGLEEIASDTLYCMSYNVNLDYVLSLFDSYSSLERVFIYANNEMISHSGRNTNRIVELINNGNLRIHYVSLNRLLIHAKVYAFHKDGKCTLAGVGSSNFSSKSNQNFEVITVFRDPIPDELPHIWSEVLSMSRGALKKTEGAPPFVYKRPPSTLFVVDSKITEGLWEHQKIIIDWLSTRTRSIVNIPPGTGKTKIALVYAMHLKNVKPNLATVILVPTKTLIQQWIGILQDAGMEAYEGGTDHSSLAGFLGAPEGCFLVTLYNRFWDYSDYILREIAIINVPFLIIADECHRLYSRLDSLFRTTQQLENNGVEYYHLGLSATIDTFYENLLDDYLSYCGGTDSQFSIELAPFYSQWNDRNDSPILKEVEYYPVFCRLSDQEMKRFKQLSKYIAIQSGSIDIDGKSVGRASIQRARFVRGTESGVRALRSLLDDAMSLINNQNTIIFVQRNEIAENIRNYITNHKLWNPDSSAYVYDSHQPERYLDYAMERFRSNKGFCLIAEQMIAEGFDLPSIAMIILHGSHRSERDWIQKVGRAIRYDKMRPDDVAKVFDIVFCDTNGNILEMEQERYATLTAISVRKIK